MDDANETCETLTVPRTIGKAFMVVVFLSFGGFLVITALRRGHLLRTIGTAVAVALCGVIAFLGLFLRDVCILTSSPRSMRIERWTVARRVHTKSIDIAAVNWVRSRWTIQGAILELGAENSWNTIEIQTTGLSRGQYAARGEQETRLNEIRASVARVLKIKDAGWEKYPTQRSLS